MVLGLLAGVEQDIKTSETYSPNITYPYAQYSPTYAQQYSITEASPQIAIESPYATQTSKKETVLAQETTPTSTQAPVVSPATTQRDTSQDNTLIYAVLIGGVAIGGLYLFTKAKK